MRLPDGFQFSQASLQAFVDCPRLFQLRYVERVAWPERVAGPPYERECQLLHGQAFHRLVSQHTAGIEPERLAPSAVGDDLERWWRSYLASPPPNLPRTRYAETTLSSPLAGYRLVAKYDLVAIASGNGR